MDAAAGQEGGISTVVALFTPRDAKGVRMRAGTVELMVHEEPPPRPPPAEAYPPAFLLQQPMLAQPKPQMPPGAVGAFSFGMDDRPSRMMEPPVPRNVLPGRGPGPSASSGKQGNLLRVNTNSAMDCMLTAALKVGRPQGAHTPIWAMNDDAIGAGQLRFLSILSSILTHPLSLSSFLPAACRWPAARPTTS